MGNIPENNTNLYYIKYFFKKRKRGKRKKQKTKNKGKRNLNACFVYHMFRIKNIISIKIKLLKEYLKESFKVIFLVLR